MSRFALAVLCLSLWSHAQEQGVIVENEATQHLAKSVEPEYPAIAKAAHVQGTVMLQANVDAQGEVTKVDVIAGPPMLTAAAVDAVRRWHYRPFEVDGKVAPVRVAVEVPFSLGIPESTERSDQAIGQSYFPKDSECRTANAAKDWAAAVVACKELVSIAERFPDQKQRVNEIRSSHEQYGIALLFSHDSQAALHEFQVGTAMADQSLTEKDAEYGMAYYWQGLAEHVSKMEADAERDYARSERSLEEAINHLPAMKTIYARYLARTYAYHSMLEMQTQHPEEAKHLQEEARQLDPRSLDWMKGNTQ